MAHVIEDDEEADRIYRKMIEDGVPVLNELPTQRLASCRPGSGGQPVFDEQ